MQLVERESSLASLAGYAQEARRGEGRLVLVAGKVTLRYEWDELLARIADDGCGAVGRLGGLPAYGVARAVAPGAPTSPGVTGWPGCRSGSRRTAGPARRGFLSRPSRRSVHMKKDDE